MPDSSPVKRHNARERHGLSTVCRPAPGASPLRRGALGLFMAHRPGLLEYANDILDNPTDAGDVAQMTWGRYVAVVHCRRRVSLER